MAQLAGLSGSHARQRAVAADAPATQKGVAGVSAQPALVVGSHSTQAALVGLQ